MSDLPRPVEGVSVDDLTPEEANRIIHSHRKVRYGKMPSLSSATREQTSLALCVSQYYTVY